MYKLIKYKAGKTIEVIRCHPMGCRKGIERQAVRKKTSEEMAQANREQAARKLARKINANFIPGDLHVILTYRQEARPSKEEAQKELKKFMTDMRKDYRAREQELKYILVTEYLNKAIHHHLVINNINDGKLTTSDLIRKRWSGKGRPKFVQLDDSGQYRKLADYFIKETEKTFRDGDSPVKQRYSCSRNLVTPKPKKKTVIAKTWRQEPTPPKGYYIDQDTLYNGIDKFGYRYQRYVLIELVPEDKTDPW